MAWIDVVKSAAARAGKMAGEVAAAGLEGFRGAVASQPSPAPASPAHAAKAPRAPASTSDVDALIKAQTGTRASDDDRKVVGQRGHEYDPIDAIGRIDASGITFSKVHLGTLGMPFTTLDRMARLPVPAVVINLAISEIAEMCHPQRDEHALGIRVKLKDDEKVPTAGQKRRMRQAEEILFRGGGKYQDGGLEGTVRRALRNSLVYDAWATETLYERGGLPYGLFAYDARTIRRNAPTSDEIAHGAWGESGYCQVVRERIVQRWSGDDFTYGVRRPRTEMEAFGYGFPELEELVGVILNLTRAENYNAVTFTSGVHSSAVLAFLTDMDPTAFEAMRRDVEANLSVASAKRRLPMVQLSGADGEDLKAVQLSMSNKEMEFQSWVFYLMKFVWALYGMDPVVGNFWFGQEGQTNSLSTGSPADRFAASRARGTRPRARAVARWLTKAIVEKIDPELMVDFGGFDDDDETQRIDNDVKQLSNWLTLDEMRARHDLEAYPDPELGKLILNPVFFQAYSLQNQADPTTGDNGVADPAVESDADLQNNMFADPRQGGSPQQIMASLYARAAEATKRGLVKPPAGLGRRGRWGLIPGGPGKAPISILVRT